MRAVIAVALVSFASTAFAAPTKEQCVEADTRAQELRNAGKLADALAQLDACMNPACPEMVRGDCSERVDEINRAMPTVVIAVRTSSGADVTDARVSMDGQTLRERLDGRPVAINPGDHTFVIEAHGQRHTVKLLLREGEKDRALGVTLAEPPPPPPRYVPPNQTLRLTGWVTGGVGVALLGVGAVFGGLAIARHDDVASQCPNNTCPDQATKDRLADANQDSQTFATLASIGIIAGAVLAATGVVLWLAAPRAPVRVGLGVIEGRF